MWSHYGHDSQSETEKQEFSMAGRTGGHKIDGGLRPERHVRSKTGFYGHWTNIKV